MNISNDIWLAKPAPRYTSYPTAPHFHEGMGAGEYIRALANMPAIEPVSLYLHIPFCRSLCLYCGCHTSITHRADRVGAYLKALEKEISVVSDKIKRKQKVSHLHFGGGSPNIINEDQIRGVFSVIRKSFDLSDCKEIAMELDPRLVSGEQITALSDCGVTRISLGVQDFNLEVQRAVNREQPYSTIANICKWARDAGIGGINFDLMYGLPLQTPETISETMRQVVELSPDRVSYFSYAHVPQLKKHQLELEKFGLPNKYRLLDLESAGREVLASAGYVAIGMDHFAKPGDRLSLALRERRLRRNFQGYTDDDAVSLIGLGASSIGLIGDAYFQNIRDVESYQKCITGGNVATIRGIALSEDDKSRASTISDLMCYMECDVDKFSPDGLKPFCKTGVTEMVGQKVRLKTPHRMAIRAICQVFDDYASRGKAIHSKVG